MTPEEFQRLYGTDTGNPMGLESMYPTDIMSDAEPFSATDADTLAALFKLMYRPGAVAENADDALRRQLLIKDMAEKQRDAAIASRKGGDEMVKGFHSEKGSDWFPRKGPSEYAPEAKGDVKEARQAYQNAMFAQTRKPNQSGLKPGLNINLKGAKNLGKPGAEIQATLDPNTVARFTQGVSDPVLRRQILNELEDDAQHIIELKHPEIEAAQSAVGGMNPVNQAVEARRQLIENMRAYGSQIKKKANMGAEAEARALEEAMVRSLAGSAYLDPGAIMNALRDMVNVGDLTFLQASGILSRVLGPAKPNLNLNVANELARMGGGQAKVAREGGVITPLATPLSPFAVSKIMPTSQKIRETSAYINPTSRLEAHQNLLLMSPEAGAPGATSARIGVPMLADRMVARLDGWPSGRLEDLYVGDFLNALKRAGYEGDVSGTSPTGYYTSKTKRKEF